MKRIANWKKGLIRLGKILLIPIIAFEVIIVTVFIREALLYVFYPVAAPLSANITDFDSIDLDYPRWINPCRGKSDITKREDFDFSANIINPHSSELFHV